MIVGKETRLSTPTGFSTIINTFYAFDGDGYVPMGRVSREKPE